MFNVVNQLNSYLQPQECKDLYVGNTIPEISKNMLISEDKLLQKANDGTLKNYLDKKVKKYGTTLEKSKKDFEAVSARYQKNSDTNLLECGDFEIPEELLMKIVRKSNLSLSKIGYFRENDFIPISIKSQPDLRIFAQKRNDNLVIFSDDATLLGKGAFGTVNKIALLTKGKFAALKTSLQHNEEISKEYDNLHALNGKPHIQKAPLAIGILRNNSEQQRAMISPLYRVGSLDKFLKVPHDIIKLDLSFQMIQALNVLKEEGIIHGDIKLANFLVKQNKQGEYKTDISDLAGALFTKETYNLVDELGDLLLNMNFNRGLGTPVTPMYFTKKDFLALSQANLKNNKKLWIDLNHSRDLFALTTSIWVLLTGAFPFFHDKSNLKFPINNVQPRNLDKMQQLVSKETLKIMTDILTLSPDKRPSVEQLLDSFTRNEVGLHSKASSLNANSNGSAVDNDDEFNSFNSYPSFKEKSESEDLSNIPEIPCEYNDLTEISVDSTNIPEIPCEFNQLDDVYYGL